MEEVNEEPITVLIKRKRSTTSTLLVSSSMATSNPLETLNSQINLSHYEDNSEGTYLCFISLCLFLLTIQCNMINSHKHFYCWECIRPSYLSLPWGCHCRSTHITPYRTKTRYLYHNFILQLAICLLLTGFVILSELLNDPIPVALVTSNLEAIASVSHVESDILSNPSTYSFGVKSPTPTLLLVTTLVSIPSIPDSLT